MVNTDPEAQLQLRRQSLCDRPERHGGRYLLYWMQQARRLHANHALDHALARARALRVPLLILEALRCDYPQACDRHHACAASQMLLHRRALAGGPIGYLPWIEPRPGAGRGLLATLLEQAAEVVSDAVPCFVVPGHNRRLAELAQQAGVAATAVDACGLLPVALLDKPCPTAAVFRRHLHRHAGAALVGSPAANPLRRCALPPFQEAWLAPIQARYGDSGPWLDRFAADPRAALAELPIDHSVAMVDETIDRASGLARLRRFLDGRLARYDERSHPDAEAASGLSPWLHWGQLGVHEIVQAVLAQDPAWSPERLPERGGARLGFWPLAESAQLFLDELLTWRELGLHSAALMGAAFTRFDSLPPWALQTLAAHAADRRPALLSRAQLEAGLSPEPLWNATMRQLRTEGRIDNHLRMLWGKLPLLWKAEPEEAYADLIHLNNRWALDGRDANSWTGVLWCFGRHDRPWPERAVYGTVRCMTAASTGRKLKMRRWLAQWHTKR